MALIVSVQRYKLTLNTVAFTLCKRSNLPNYTACIIQDFYKGREKSMKDRKKKEKKKDIKRKRKKTVKNLNGRIKERKKE